MSAASRRKGLTGEREVAQAFTEHGFDVRGLEGSGDLLVFKSIPLAVNDYLAKRHTDGLRGLRGITYQVESKRYRERARWTEWIEQAASEAPDGVPWMLVARGDRRKALAVTPFADLLDVIA